MPWATTSSEVCTRYQYWIFIESAKIRKLLTIETTRRACSVSFIASFLCLQVHATKNERSTAPTMQLLSLLVALFISSAACASSASGTDKDSLTWEAFRSRLERQDPTQTLGYDHSNVYEGRRTRSDGTLEASTPLLADAFEGGQPGFYHSVASGDPLPNAVVIWTRYTPALVTDVVNLEFRIAKINKNDEVEMASLLDPQVNEKLKRGLVPVSAEHDWVAKIDVRGLDSNSHYVFAFIAEDGSVSDVGYTRTAPGRKDHTEKLRYAVFSCSNFVSAKKSSRMPSYQE